MQRAKWPVASVQLQLTPSRASRGSKDGHAITRKAVDDDGHFHGVDAVEMSGQGARQVERCLQAGFLSGIIVHEQQNILHDRPPWFAIEA
jgi:hypothetical protein